MLVEKYGSLRKIICHFSDDLHFLKIRAPKESLTRRQWIFDISSIKIEQLDSKQVIK